MRLASLSSVLKQVVWQRAIRISPLHELAADLGLAICIHQGGGWTPVTSNLSAFSQPGTFPVLSAFSSLMNANISERIPGLMVGFIESEAPRGCPIFWAATDGTGKAVGQTVQVVLLILDFT